MTAFETAMALYGKLVPRNHMGEPIMGDSATRQRVAESLHQSHPGWYKRLNLDTVEEELWENRQQEMLSAQ